MLFTKTDILFTCEHHSGFLKLDKSMTLIENYKQFDVNLIGENSIPKFLTPTMLLVSHPNLTLYDFADAYQKFSN